MKFVVEHILYIFSEKVFYQERSRDIEVLMKTVIFTPGLLGTEMRNYLVKKANERDGNEKKKKTEMNTRGTRNKMRRE